MNEDITLLNILNYLHKHSIHLNALNKYVSINIAESVDSKFSGKLIMITTSQFVAKPLSTISFILMVIFFHIKVFLFYNTNLFKQQKNKISISGFYIFLKKNNNWIFILSMRIRFTVMNSILLFILFSS